MLKDVLYCDFCGRAVRIYGTEYCHYEKRWFEHFFVTACQDCLPRIPKERPEDKPRHIREMEK